MKSWNVTLSVWPRPRPSRWTSPAPWICKRRPGANRRQISRGPPRRDARPSPTSRGLLKEVQSLGWGVLADVPGREVVVGAVTKPWEANVTFRALPPDQFAAFDEPGYVRIAWTIRADPISETECRFRTETRAIATDPDARIRFRRYWSFLSPGILAIRWAVLGPVKKEAEHRVRETGHAPQAALHHQPR